MLTTRLLAPLVCLLSLECTLMGASTALGGIHNAPIILSAKSIRTIQYHPLAMYRVFRTGPDGTAEPIPFQIDERDSFGDFVLDQGPLPNSKYSNGIFDFNDELSFMGNDVGPARPPSKWPFKKPSVLYEIKLKRPASPTPPPSGLEASINPPPAASQPQEGAVYVGAYFSHPPPLSENNYVKFHLGQAEVVTSRYRYRFDRKNYLVVRGVDILSKEGAPNLLLDSSTFFLRADLKYFLTFAINQSDIQSQLEAYKSGPIRTIARVTFNYKILKLNFDLGMYTEVSFFSNSVILPATIDNPLEGRKILNKGSLFYYGFSIMDNPMNLKLQTNMPRYEEGNILDFLKGKRKVENHYWFTAIHPNYMIYIEMSPSQQMKAAGNVPMFYKEDVAATDLAKREKKAAPLGKSPVNMALALDLTSFTEGLHEVALRLFVENRSDEERLEELRTLDQWKAEAVRLPANAVQ